MKEEMEMNEGAEMTEEEMPEASADFDEFSEEELKRISGGLPGMSRDGGMRGYCPLCRSYHYLYPQKRYTGRLGGVEVKRLRVFFCETHKTTFYGPSDNYEYWDASGRRLA